MEHEVDLNKFPLSAKDHFSYLIDDFGFSLIEDEDKGTSHNLIYYKKGLYVFIRYNYYDDMFLFSLRKELNGKPAENYGDEDNNWDFIDLIRLRRPEINFNQLIPKNQDFEAALELNARLLKETSNNILNGSFWPQR